MRSIRFAAPGEFVSHASWDDAAVIVEQNPNHEGHFGILVGCLRGDRSVGVCSVEHAQALIGALQQAIDDDFLFTNKQLEEHITTATDTRTTIKRKIRAAKD